MDDAVPNRNILVSKFRVWATLLTSLILQIQWKCSIQVKIYSQRLIFNIFQNFCDFLKIFPTFVNFYTFLWWRTAASKFLAGIFLFFWKLATGSGVVPVNYRRSNVRWSLAGWQTCSLTTPNNTLHNPNNDNIFYYAPDNGYHLSTRAFCIVPNFKFS